MALAMKLLSPVMLHVTTVRSPSGRNVNSAMLVFLNGFRKSSLTRMRSLGRLSVIVMRPSPTFLSPTHEYEAPTPAGAPSYDCFIAGSSLPHGFQALHLWKSFTCANTSSA